MAQIVWLDGAGVDPGEVGVRAATLARLRAGGLPVPRAFILGRSLFDRFRERAKRDDALHVPTKLPTDLNGAIIEALRAFGGSCAYAIRRSPLEGDPESADWMTTTLGGRPERETYLNLTDAAEVCEAVRRVWGPAVTSPPSAPVAIVVQRFMAPDVCALVRRDRTDPDLLHVASSLGVGDLLAAGLVVPDRHTLRCDGHVLACSPGRKAQMTVPRAGGGVVRVPVPAHAARLLAIDDAKLAEIASTWRAAASAQPGLKALGLSWSGGKWHVTSAALIAASAQDKAMLG